MNKKQETKKPDYQSIVPVLSAIADSLQDIKALMFQRTLFQQGIDSETLTSLLKAKENKNEKKK